MVQGERDSGPGKAYQTAHEKVYGIVWRLTFPEGIFMSESAMRTGSSLGAGTRGFRRKRRREMAEHFR